MESIVTSAYLLLLNYVVKIAAYEASLNLQRITAVAMA